MLYLVNTKRKFNKIVAQAEGTMAIDFHYNFMVKTGQANEDDFMTVSVNYEPFFEMFVAGAEGCDATDVMCASDTEEKALNDFIEYWERTHG